MKRFVVVLSLVILSLIPTTTTTAYQSKKQLKEPDAKGLLGTWEASEEGETIRLVFKSATVLEFEGEESSYRIMSGAIRVSDPYEGDVDYPFLLKGDVLVLTFPEGEQWEFRRAGKSPHASATGTNPKTSVGGSTANSQNHLLVGKFMSYSSASSSSGSSSWTTYVTFDGRGVFEWSSESAHSTQQYNQQGDNTGWGVASGSNSGNRGQYRVVGDRILVTFADGSKDEAIVTERFQDGSIGAFKYDGKMYAR